MLLKILSISALGIIIVDASSAALIKGVAYTSWIAFRLSTYFVSVIRISFTICVRSCRRFARCVSSSFSNLRLEGLLRGLFPRLRSLLLGAYCQLRVVMESKSSRTDIAFDMAQKSEPLKKSFLKAYVGQLPAPWCPECCLSCIDF